MTDQTPIPTEDRAALTDAEQLTLYRLVVGECEFSTTDLYGAVERIKADAYRAGVDEAARELDALTNRARQQVADLSAAGRDEDASSADLFAVAYNRAAQVVRTCVDHTPDAE